MRRPWALLALLVAAACAPSPTTSSAPEAAAGARRIVSLDYCADQYVLKLVDRDRILAISPNADADFSYMRAAAAGVPRVRPTAENVLVLKPDLIVRSYGGGPNAEAFFENAGVPVITLGYASDIAGVERVIADVAAALGVPERGAAVIREMNARLAAVRRDGPDASALYMTEGGVTAGPGTLVDDILAAAGLDNFQRDPGWRALPLERLAYEQPDLVATSFFGSRTVNAWTPARHPVARRQMTERPVVVLDDAWTSCGAWFLLDAVEALARGPEEAAR